MRDRRARAECPERQEARAKRLPEARADHHLLARMAVAGHAGRQAEEHVRNRRDREHETGKGDRPTVEHEHGNATIPSPSAK